MDNVKCANCGAGNNLNAKYCASCGHSLPKTKTEITDTQTQPTVVSNTNHTPRKKVLALAVGAVAFIVTYIGIQQLLFSKPSFDKIMMQAASEINKTCPVMVDAETRLDNSIALPNNTFQYNYTLVRADKSMIDTIELKGLLEPGIINQIKTNPQMKAWVDNRVVINYLYKDKNGMYICMIQLTPDKYE